jgi:hypothetical protein
MGEGETTRQASERMLAKKREIEARLDEARREFAEIGARVLVEHFAELFVRHPDARGFRWSQYTPFFNDGDPCTFSSDHEYGEILLIDPAADPDDEPEFVTIEDAGWIECDTPEHRRLNEINDEFRRHFPDLRDDDMESLFGDHVRVTIYPDRVATEEYDHS